MQIRIQMDDYNEYFWKIGPDTEYMVDGPFSSLAKKGSRLACTPWLISGRW